MTLVLRAASIIDSASDVWLQTYCKNGVGLILQLQDKEKGREALEQLVYLLRKSHPQTLAEFREKIERTVEKYAAADDDFSLGVLRIVDGEGFFYTKGSSVLLAREKKVAILREDNGVISGPLQNKDRVLLLNREGIERVGLQKITKLLSGKLKVETIAEELLLEVHRHHGNTAILGLTIEARSSAQQVVAKAESHFLTQLLQLNLTYTLSTVVSQIITTLLKLLRVRKVWVILGFIILVVFLLSQFNSSGLDSHQLSEDLELARHKYEEGKALVELNRLRARDVLSESKTTLEELRATLKKGEEEYKRVSELLLAVEQALKDARSAYKVEPDLFFDLSLVRDGLTANLMRQAGSSVFLLSPNQRLIVTVDIQTKASKVVAGEKWFADISQMAVTTGKQYVLSSNGVTEITSSQQTVIEMDEEWGEIKDLEYFEGNLYLLDKEGFIWKYIPTGGGFASKRNFLKGDLRLQNPHSMAIDGVVWVMDDGQVLKFIAGRRDSFFVRGLEEPLGIEAQIVKTPELDNLYILDKQKSRIVVLGEDGVYKSQYSWDGLREVTDFVVSEDLGKMFLLKKDKMYTIQLE